MQETTQNQEAPVFSNTVLAEHPSVTRAKYEAVASDDTIRKLNKEKANVYGRNMCKWIYTDGILSQAPLSEYQLLLISQLDSLIELRTNQICSLF